MVGELHEPFRPKEESAIGMLLLRSKLESGTKFWAFEHKLSSIRINKYRVLFIPGLIMPKSTKDTGFLKML
jgi:hypothetical protein